MAKEWILNQAMNRWGLNKKRCVGAVVALIRECQPRTKREWEDFYFSTAYPKEHLEELGQKLFVKITEVIQHEVQEVTEEDCIAYMKTVVIDRTYDGYVTEIETIYGQLEDELGVEIQSAPDKWDRLYNVDFFIPVGKSSVGIQIKPVSFDHTADRHKWDQIQEHTHEAFRQEYGGGVFTVYSTKEGKSKIIVNREVIAELKAELERLANPA